MSLLGRRVVSKIIEQYGTIVACDNIYVIIVLHTGLGIGTLNETIYKNMDIIENITEYEGKGFYAFSKHNLSMFYNLGKLYPNTKMFQKLYPEGREFNGFWEVL